MEMGSVPFRNPFLWFGEDCGLDLRLIGGVLQNRMEVQRNCIDAF